MSYLPIAILGYGQTTFGELWDLSLSDLFSQAIDLALANAGVKSQDIDAVFVANMASGSFERQLHLNSLVSSMFKHHPPAFRLEAACASGSMAVLAATMGLQSGNYKKVLVVGAEKMTDVTVSEATSILSGASSISTEYGSTFPALYALLARLYQSRYHVSESDLRHALSSISSRAHDSALVNPHAQFRKSISPATVTSSPLIADPLRVLDCSPLSDGASALVLTLDPDKSSYPALSHLIAAGHAQDSLDLASRSDLPHLTATRDSVAQIYSKSGLTPKDIGVVELHDCFTIAEVLAIEDLGFLPSGTAVNSLLKNNHYLPNLIVNPSGGLKGCGHPVAATGIKQIGYLSQYLKLSDPPLKYGLTHNVGGTGGTVITHLLEKGAI